MIEQLRSSFALLSETAKRQAWWLGVMIMINSIMEAASLGLVFGVVNLMSDPAIIQANVYSAYVFENFGFEDATGFIAVCILSLIGIFIFKAVFYLFMTWQKYSFATTNESLVSAQLLDSYFRGSFTHVGMRNSAELITNIGNRVFSVVHTTILGTITIATDLFTVVAVCILLLVLQPEITLIAASFLSLSILLGTIGLRKTLLHLGTEDAMLSQRFLKALHEGFDNLRQIKILHKENFFARRFLNIRLQQAALRRKLFTLQETPRQLIELVVLLGMLIALLVTLYWYTDASNVLAVVALFGLAIFRVLPLSNRILFTINHIQSQKANVEKVIADFRDLRVEHQLTLDDKRPAPEAGETFAFRKSIRLIDVSFSYPGADYPALNHVNLEIFKGQKVGIVGPSGAGKSSLANLLMCLHTAQSGRFLIDDVPVEKISSDWQSLLGYVPQSINLMDDTLRRNVAFGLDDDQIDAARMDRVITDTHLEQVVRSWPDGLDTILGEDGARLSGGQIQRVGIARALYHDPEVLILDEATSSLDMQTEKDINQSIESITRDKTLIVIAHRLTTVKHCDVLYYMKDGAAADHGAFAELMEKNLDFRKVVELMA